MKIYITQGHESGIGLEVFFKSCLLMSSSKLNNLQLIAFKSAVEATLVNLKIPYKIEDKSIYLAGLKINTEWQEKNEFSQSLTCLNRGMKLAEQGAILFTLPTSKDQFKDSAGHTEYFRRFYKKPDLGMFFTSPARQILLLSDHIPLKNVVNELSLEVIQARIQNALDSLSKWNWPLHHVLISGFNPHAGEKGLIGQEDMRIEQAIKRITTSNYSLSGPWPADTMALESRDKRDLLVYLYHDQGLGVFKSLEGFIGANITLGLPYPRISPDHGTSFKLYGKNQADYRGCAFALKEALELLQRMKEWKKFK
jgi:4-hydroxythreonine-4-phosphate dehydrogenase